MEKCRPLILSKTLPWFLFPKLSLPTLTLAGGGSGCVRPGAHCNQWPPWARAATKARARGGGLGMRHSVRPTVRNCAVASSCSARRHWRHSERHGDGAHPAPPCCPAPRCPRCGIMSLFVHIVFGFVFILVVPGKQRSRILGALFLSQMVISNCKRKRNHHWSNKRIVKYMLVLDQNQLQLPQLHRYSLNPTVDVVVP